MFKTFCNFLFFIFLNSYLFSQQLINIDGTKIYIIEHSVNSVKYFKYFPAELKVSSEDNIPQISFMIIKNNKQDTIGAIFTFLLTYEFDEQTLVKLNDSLQKFFPGCIIKSDFEVDNLESDISYNKNILLGQYLGNNKCAGSKLGNSLGSKMAYSCRFNSLETKSLYHSFINGSDQEESIIKSSFKIKEPGYHNEVINISLPYKKLIKYLEL